MSITFSSWKTVSLTAKLTAAATTLTADIDVWVTIGRFYFVNDNQEEWISFTWVSANGSYFDYTWLTRWLSQTADPATAWTGKTWWASNKGVLVSMHDQLLNKLKDNTLVWNNTFEEAVITEKWVASTIYASTAARDSALWGDWVPTIAYTWIQAWSVFYNYNTWTAQWESVDTGTTTPNGSTTVAWKFEEWTVAEQWTATATGWTGARNVVAVANLVKTSSWSWDENKIAILNSYWYYSNFVPASIFWDGSDWDVTIASWTTNIALDTVFNYHNLQIDVWAVLSTAWTSGQMTIKVNGTLTLNWDIDITGIDSNASISNIYWLTIAFSAIWAGWAWWAGWTNTNAWWAGWVWASWYGWGWGWGASSSSTYSWWAGWAWWTPAWTWWTWWSDAAGWAGWVSAGWGWGWVDWGWTWWSWWTGWNAYWNIWADWDEWSSSWNWGWGWGAGWDIWKSPLILIYAKNITGTWKFIMDWWAGWAWWAGWTAWVDWAGWTAWGTWTTWGAANKSINLLKDLI